MASLTLSNALTPRALATLANWTFDDRDDFATRLTQFDDIYETVQYSVYTRDDIDAEVIAEARRIVESTNENTPDR